MIDFVQALISAAMGFFIITIVFILLKVILDYLVTTDFKIAKEFWYFLLKWIKEKAKPIEEYLNREIDKVERSEDDEEN